MKGVTDSYIDDILVDVMNILTMKVENHLKEFGLTANPLESLKGEAALVLKLKKGKEGKLVFRKGDEVVRIIRKMSMWELFLIWGKLVGHYPIVRWLQLACSYVKRISSGIDWKEKVDEKTVAMMQEILAEIKKEDLVIGTWHISETKTGLVWCDASSIATGVIMEIGGLIAEDAAWLRKKATIITLI